MKPNVLFIYEMEPRLEAQWNDGLAAALRELEKIFNIDRLNIVESTEILHVYDFVLGWGAFGSSVDRLLGRWTDQQPKGLCIGGITPLSDLSEYDVLFYETEWHAAQLDHPNKVHAFGYNEEIFFPYYAEEKLWDYTTVGAFADWKRQDMLANKEGLRFAVGQIQEGNPDESYRIIANLLRNGVAVSDMVSPKDLNKIYNLSRTVYLPASVNGGGERAVLEARAAGCLVEVADDNPKLQELVAAPLWDSHYYAKQLKKGIMSCL